MNRRPLLLVALSFSMPAAVPPSSEQSSGIKFLADTLMIQAEGPIPISPRFPWAFPRGTKDGKTAYDRA